MIAKRIHREFPACRSNRAFRPAWLLAAACLLALLPMGGCNPESRSTRIQWADMLEVTDTMAQSLARSPFMTDRSPQSPPVVIVINKVQNLTTDIIPEREQWLLMARLRGLLSTNRLGAEKNIHFQIEPERWEMLRKAGFQDDLGGKNPATHVMTAVFRSARREARSLADGGQVGMLSDFYYIEYSVLNLGDRHIDWTDRFEFKRQAQGLRID